MRARLGFPCNFTKTKIVPYRYFRLRLDMIIKPTLTALRAFDCLARTGSFTQAAAALNVTRPAISKQVKELETTLNCKLVHRSGPNIVLTEQGVDLARGLKDGFDLIASTTQRVQASHTPSNTIRLLVERDFATFWLAQKLGTFLIENPGLSVELTADTNGRLRMEDDFSFRIFYGPEGRFDTANLTETFLCNWIDIPLCTPDYAATEIDPNDPYGSARLLVDENYNPWDYWFADTGLRSPDKPLEFTRFNDTTLCLSAALSGAGVTIGDSILCLDAIETGRLIAPFKLGMRSTQRYSLCQPAGRTSTPAERVFERWLTQEVADFQQSVMRILHAKGIEIVN